MRCCGIDETDKVAILLPLYGIYVFFSNSYLQRERAGVVRLMEI